MLSFINQKTGELANMAAEFCYQKAAYTVGTQVASQVGTHAAEKALDIQSDVQPVQAVAPNMAQRMLVAKETIKMEAICLGSEAVFNGLTNCINEDYLTHAALSRMATTAYRCQNQAYQDYCAIALEASTEALSHAAATYLADLYKTAAVSDDTNTAFLAGSLYGLTKVVTKSALMHPQETVVCLGNGMLAAGTGLLNLFNRAKTAYQQIDFDVLDEVAENAFGNGSCLK